MRFGIGNIPLALSATGGLSISLQAFETSGFFVMSFRNSPLVFDGWALAVRFD